MRPLLALAAACAAGCLVCLRAGSGSVAALVGLSALLLALAVRARRRRPAMAALLGAAFGLGAANAEGERREHEAAPLWSWVEARPEGTPVMAVEGTACGDAQAWPDRTVLVVDVVRVEE